jgi:uncharacterized protein
MTFKMKLLILALIPALFAFVGCGSDGDTFSPTVVDTAPPATPLGLGASIWNDSVVLEWKTNNTDADFSGFKVYRIIDSEVLELTGEEISKNCFTDNSPVVDSYNIYRVTSVDFSGNESAYAVISIFVDQDDNHSLDPSGDETDYTPPAKPQNLQFKVLDYGVVLTWDNNTLDPDFHGFLVYRVVDRKIVELTWSPITENLFTDRLPVKGKKNEYRVIAVDSRGNQSEDSRVQMYIEK